MNTPSTAEPLLKTARLGHGTLECVDIGRTRRFYEEVLGLEVLMRDERGQFALLGAGSARLALKGGESGGEGVLLAFEVDELERWLDRLASLGVSCEGEVKASAEGYRRAKLRDPEGHGISLFEWTRG